MSKKQVAVAVPFYKNVLSETEAISLKQVVRILGSYDICFIVPDSLEIRTEYDVCVKRFDDGYFKSVDTYNRLMTDADFYRHFVGYKYVLIYQLDAFVFSDNLDYFCGMDYDYIGAPWIRGAFHYRDKDRMLWHVGNGGLSLRNVDSFIRILEKCQDLLHSTKMSEDLFFSVLDGESFSVAPENVALEFSFEMKVRECYAKNKYRIPFGCHAWHRYDLAFWKPWIEEEGYVIPEEICTKGNEDNDPTEKDKRREALHFGGRAFKEEDLRMLIQKVFNGSERDLAIWGAGYWGQMICRMFKDAGIGVKLLVDRNAALQGRKIYGYSIVPPEFLETVNTKYHIVIAIEEGYENMAAFLDALGYRHRKEYIYLDDLICAIKYAPGD